MLQKKARLFMNGGSQAIRLPAEFRFNTSEVFVRRDVHTGDVIISKKPGFSSWVQYLAQRNAADISPDFMTDRPLNEPLQDKLIFKSRKAK